MLLPPSEVLATRHARLRRSLASLGLDAIIVTSPINQRYLINHVGSAGVLVGTGDAMTFICVLRLIPAWFSVSQVPVITQLTGLLGQAGQVASTIPLAPASLPMDAMRESTACPLADARSSIKRSK